MESINSMSRQLHMILYLLMTTSLGVLIATSWYSQKAITAVIAEERRYQERRIAKGTEEIDLLRQLANTLAACTSINEAQRVVADIIPRLLGQTYGCISIMRESHNLLEIELEWGGKWPGDRSYSPSDCWAMRKGKYHLSHEKNQVLHCNHMAPTTQDNTTMCIPLTAHGNTVGIFHLYFDADEGLVSEQTKQLAFTIAEHLGLALANLRLQEKLRSQAMRDPLTSLYNRRYFEDKLENEVSVAQNKNSHLSILMLDLDHFKHFNDSFGHDAGDYVLKEISNLMCSVVDKHIAVCRFGGEEFAVIAPDLDHNEAIELANQIVCRVRDLHLECRGLSLGQLGISVGVSTYPEQNATAEELVKMADEALYQAKEQGRNRAVHFLN